MICRSDLRTCLGAMFNRLRAGDDTIWTLFYDSDAESYALYTIDDDDMPYNGVQRGDLRPVFLITRLELLVLLSEPVIGIFKEMKDANAAPSVPTGE